MNINIVSNIILDVSKVFWWPYNHLMYWSHMITSIIKYMSNITCDKEKVNEMKLHMLMLMNAWMMLVLMKCKCQMQCLTLGLLTPKLGNFVANKVYRRKPTIWWIISQRRQIPGCMTTIWKLIERDYVGRVFRHVDRRCSQMEFWMNNEHMFYSASGGEIIIEKRIAIAACRWNYEGLPYMYFYMRAGPCNVFVLQLATCFCLADAWPNKIDFYKKVKACTCKQSWSK